MSRLPAHSTCACWGDVICNFAGQRNSASPWVCAEVLCCAPLLPSALPSEGYAREGGGVGFGRCPVRVGVGHGQGAVRWPATRAGFDPARNLNEWPPGLARRGPQPEQVGKAHGAGRPTRELRTGQRPAAASPSAWPSPCWNARASSRFWSSAALSLRGLVAGRPAVAEPRAGRVGGRAARDPRQRVALKT